MSDTESLFEGVPTAPFATAIPSARDASRLLPQVVAHRGYKALWPENTLEGMRAAVGAGAHGIETDVHLSRDGVVVMSHDASLKRCYGVDKKIADCDWAYISTLRSLRAPHLGMPRLTDVLGLLAEEEEGMERVWCVLDIKIDDDAEKLLSAIKKALESVKGTVPWEERIILGCWNATYITTALRILPTMPLSHISWSRSYSRHFGAAIPNLGYSLHFSNLSGVLGSRFLRQARTHHHHHHHHHNDDPGMALKQDRLVFTWTVNSEKWMRWILDRNITRKPATTRWRRSGSGSGKEEPVVAVVETKRVVDAVITDDPKMFLEACERWEDGLDGKSGGQEGGQGGGGGGGSSSSSGGVVRRARSAWEDALEFAKLTLLWMVMFVARRMLKRLDTLGDVKKHKKE